MSRANVKNRADSSAKRRQRRTIRGALAAAAGARPGPQPGYMLGGQAVAAAEVVTATVVNAVPSVMLSAMLGRRDPAPHFLRLMLIICAITGRPPGDHLPTAGGWPSSRPKRSGAAIREHAE